MRVYRKQIERITIIYEHDEKRKAFQYCDDGGFAIVWSGPKPIAKYRYDTSKGRLIAERTVARKGDR